MCLTENYLEKYRRHLVSEGYKQHPSGNKLRDADDQYAEKGHMFSFNGDILFSFDVCGSCEAHALLLGVRSGLASRINAAQTLDELDSKYVVGNVNMKKCPRK